MFPLAVIAYVLLKDANKTGSLLLRVEPGRAIALTVACVLAVTAGLSWLGTASPEYLPSLFVDQTQQTPFTHRLVGAIWILNAIALVLLFVRRRTILDIWLIVTVFVSLPDLGLSIVYTVVRYSVGWYTARSYALIATCTVLIRIARRNDDVYARLPACS